ncbi:tyrosine-type recombinase/integrase [Leuconostoc sp.]|uniref:tyrosine-type recombinase/integrase n=1 Tax=Leuconostoc sp. TaxID=1930076 RepID=UPI002649CC03|nr:tyrosine-type recombinase/integrase [Leuconostoc sp.]MDN6032122.1 tyrosine-type recombinase/integrase [Lactococcus lactis]MDN6085509.1 tyrosine-type recombinase/integrase [Lactococcus plantarum]MDN6033781.1 tyrosine-type recombinase/integrase [Lactococcus lactis]MDN6054330.1 tyrosine-type recombinase/integrase [Lactococcus lactis]MDN6069166.1 tyrosine-type recombinase/integrase [Leuconostoc sp.]
MKDSNVLKEVQDTLLHNFKYGCRSYTIFQVGKATLLRVSDVLALRRTEIFNDDETVVKNAYIRDKKTGKPNILYLKPAKQDLLTYFQWLNQQNLHSDWLFPSIQHPNRHITEKQFYKIIAKTGDLLGIDYLGTHTMRKTGAYRVYTQNHYNIGLVMSLLNHSSEAMTLKYLGLDQISREKMLDEVKFG